MKLMKSLHFNDATNIEPDRLMALVEGVFAIAITLLVLDIKIPNSGFATQAALNVFMLSVTHRLFVFLISFVVLSSFWVYHHFFIRVTRTTIPFLWLNLLFLLSIVLVPFTTSIISDNSNFISANILFSGNIILCNFLLYLLFYYSLNRGILEKSIEVAKKHIHISLIFTLVYTVIVGILYIFFANTALLLYFLLPVFSSLRATYHRKTAENEGYDV